MQEVVRIRRLKKDGSADRAVYQSVISVLSGGSTVVLPVDGIYGLAAVPGKDYVPPDMGSGAADFLINEFSLLEGRAKITKAEYDFLMRIWPDEISVILDTCNGGRPACVRV
ncbi:MAG: hypothetical protein ACRCUT_04295, partial [Spirochaetota bacterium]